MFPAYLGRQTSTVPRLVTSRVQIPLPQPLSARGRAALYSFFFSFRDGLQRRCHGPLRQVVGGKILLHFSRPGQHCQKAVFASMNSDSRKIHSWKVFYLSILPQGPPIRRRTPYVQIYLVAPSTVWRRDYEVAQYTKLFTGRVRYQFASILQELDVSLSEEVGWPLKFYTLTSSMIGENPNV
jgi:hypothetical protein